MWSLCLSEHLHPCNITLSRRRGRGHLVVSSSIWDSMGTLESWVEDGSFLSLSLRWCLVFEAGRPVGQQWPLL